MRRFGYKTQDLATSKQIVASTDTVWTHDRECKLQECRDTKCSDGPGGDSQLH